MINRTLTKNSISRSDALASDAAGFSPEMAQEADAAGDTLIGKARFAGSRRSPFRLSPLAGSIALALGAFVASPAGAQNNQDAQADIAQDRNEDTEQILEEVMVTGVRSSLIEAMDVKRDSDGVVDSIVAEDMGKFPDTNLAESLQRITGVSIDRTGQLGAEGEGQRITVRGIGSDFNLVLLNGRTMPSSSIFATNVTAGRSFDFSNLASEAVAAVEVYKTSMSSIPTGGIGATVNILTARPLAIGERQMSFGAKGVYDTSDQDNAWSPEFSGIYSDVFADGTFGITVSAVYQERKFGYNQAATSSGWIPGAYLDPSWQALPAAGGPGSENYENLPGEGDLYSLPQNILYSMNDVDRKRFNGQAVMQWAPTDDLTMTLDYTYADQKIDQRGNDLSFWFIQCGVCGTSSGSFTDGPVASPLVWSEDSTDTNPGRDFGTGASQAGWETKLDSVGFNAAWDATDSLGFGLDYHHSKSDTGRTSPYGSSSTIGIPAFLSDNKITVDYSADFPVMSAERPLDASEHQFSGAAFRSSYSEMKIDQLDLSGYFDINDRQSLDFGVVLTETKNRTAFKDTQYPNWNGVGVGTPEDIPDDLFTYRDVRSLFDSLPGHGNPNLFNQMFEFDFPTMAALREQLSGQTSAASDDFDTDLRTKEKTKAGYLQWLFNFDIGGMNSNLRLGVRYEKTKVKSSALVPVPEYLGWVAANEYFITFGDPDFTQLDGSYSNWLPNVDFNIEVTDGVILRASYSETIARQSWTDIQGGTTLNSLVRRSFGNAASGDPGLKPLESKNIDFSAEWYYAEGSYISAGYFHKKVDNYVGITTVNGTPFDIPHPGNGLWYDECNAATGNASDQNAIRECIFDTYPDSPYVDVANQTIKGVPGQDPSAVFLISVPTNQQNAKIDGWEFAVQHLFGESGFGLIANYTIVDSNIEYDNFSLNDQFAIPGLSDSANVVAFYEKDAWTARVAWNWRDEFLSGTRDGNGIANPVYTEKYSQLDAIVSYTFDNGITLFAEGFNLTDNYLRQHSRAVQQVEYITQQGPRYGVGVRWVY